MSDDTMTREPAMSPPRRRRSPWWLMLLPLATIAAPVPAAAEYEYAYVCWSKKSFSVVTKDSYTRYDGRHPELQAFLMESGVKENDVMSVFSARKITDMLNDGWRLGSGGLSPGWFCQSLVKD